MRYLLIILFYTFSLKIFCFEDKIEFKRFGIITIGDNVNYIGKHLWDVNFFIEDSLFSIILESKTNDKYIYYNLSEKLNDHDSITQIKWNSEDINNLQLHAYSIHMPDKETIEAELLSLSPAFCDNHRGIKSSQNNNKHRIALVVG